MFGLFKCKPCVAPPTPQLSDIELIAVCANRLRERETEARASGNAKKLRALVKAHGAIEKIMRAYAVETGGDVVAFSGGVKP
jgi:C4-dicarboxylate-specific signal transduction histidine kinase